VLVSLTSAASDALFVVPSRLKGVSPMEIKRRLRLFEHETEASFMKRDLCTKSFVEGLLATCDVVTPDDATRGERLARIALRLSEELEDIHFIARSHGVIGAPLRLQGRLDEAEEQYTIGLTLATGCPCRDPGYEIPDGDVRCGPDLLRRRGFLWIDQSLAGERTWSETEALAQEAVALATTDEALGQALIPLSRVHFFCGQKQKALADCGRALRELLPLGGRWKWLRDWRWTHHSGALQNVIRILSDSNDSDDIRRGLTLFPEVRSAWAGLRNISPTRAILDWNEASLTLKAVDLGLIDEDVAVGTRANAIETLLHARNRLKTPVDIMAISLDIARALLPDVRRVNAVLTSITCPKDMKSQYEGLFRVKTRSEFTQALIKFRHRMTEHGAPPAIFVY
jgi:hypothetical protein